MHPVRCASPSRRCKCSSRTSLGRDWKLFAIVRCPDRKKLPIMLSGREVRRLLVVVHEPRFRVADFPLPDAPFRVIKVLVPTLEGYFSMHGIESGDRCDNEAANRRVRLNSW